MLVAGCGHGRVESSARSTSNTGWVPLPTSMDEIGVEKFARSSGIAPRPPPPRRSSSRRNAARRASPASRAVRRTRFAIARLRGLRQRVGERDEDRGGIAVGRTTATRSTRARSAGRSPRLRHAHVDLARRSPASWLAIARASARLRARAPPTARAAASPRRRRSRSSARAVAGSGGQRRPAPADRAGASAPARRRRRPRARAVGGRARATALAARARPRAASARDRRAGPRAPTTAPRARASTPTGQIVEREVGRARADRRLQRVGVGQPRDRDAARRRPGRRRSAPLVAPLHAREVDQRRTSAPRRGSGRSTWRASRCGHLAVRRVARHRACDRHRQAGQERRVGALERDRDQPAVRAHAAQVRVLARAERLGADDLVEQRGARRARRRIEQALERGLHVLGRRAAGRPRSAGPRAAARARCGCRARSRAGRAPGPARSRCPAAPRHPRSARAACRARSRRRATGACSRTPGSRLGSGCAVTTRSALAVAPAPRAALGRRGGAVVAPAEARAAAGGDQRRAPPAAAHAQRPRGAAAHPEPGGRSSDRARPQPKRPPCEIQ